MQETLLIEYADILERYMRKFGLETIDIAFLAIVNKKTIDAILNKTGGIELDSLEAISQIFGLRYFQLGNPGFKMPSFDSLPEKTKTRIVFREKEGTHKETTYDQRLLNEKITVVLTKYDKGDEFLSKHIATQLFETFKENVSTSEVGKRLVNSLNEYVFQTKKKYNGKESKGRKPYYFQLIKKIPAEVLAMAKKKVGE